ncbi:polysaccharide biosynthesis protein CapD [Aureimonas endophytica]|uniref:Polysaccharide biosynthesis protein CapD n=1 Tax=Aureimonas endophytica TaxID=2027858 RepID=A0A917A2L9_9HYPH|nr:polysaccharide biosynthesis protein [Aureimonas endophytica]GGE23624.1 polysaccharide biosynthesis protein CapD [Aureimonas endophytica]
MPQIKAGSGRMLLLRGIALTHDVVVGALAMLLSLGLRLGDERFWLGIDGYLVTSLAFGLLVGAIGFTVGLNRGIWRYASLPELISVMKTATVSVLLFVFMHFLVVRLDNPMIPRSTPVITWALLVVMLAAPRAAYRSYRNHRDTVRLGRAARQSAKRVILVGASDNADIFLRMVSEQIGSNYEVLAILDERGRRVGRWIRGVPIVGTLDRLPEIVRRFEEEGQRPDALILTRSREDFERHASIDELIELASVEGLPLLRLADMLDMRDVAAPPEIRPIRLEDLLQRRPLRLANRDVSELIAGRTVLITGGGGSIGSELGRQIAALKPARLVIVDASEFVLFEAESALKRLAPQLEVRALIGNVREAATVDRIFARERPHVVFHAAALKHVPIVEAQPLEGMFTNAIGTRNVVRAAVRARVGAMVMVSTDKAVNPTNVMGATKRLAEMVCQAEDIAAGTEGTRFVTVRFGNVLGSAGSVVPTFEKQLEAGGPLTVTHPEIERYFMTIKEACFLVLEAAAHGLAHRAERGRIFVLDMGRPVKIVELARDVIRLSGLRPDSDVKIVFTGLRPGEKLTEELFDPAETLSHTAVEGLLTAFPRAIEAPLVARILDEMQRHIEADDAASALRLLSGTVPEFRPGREALALMGPAAPVPGLEPRDGGTILSLPGLKRGEAPEQP